MGTTLELSKLVAASWLKTNWERIPFLMKTYMSIAVIVLMLITSMGIFGFLSKAHSDQAVPTGDTAAKIQIIDEKIAIQQEYIAQARKDIEVLNTQIDKYNELGAVSKGVKVRDQQKAEREQLVSQIEKSQDTITKLREERAPIAASMRAIEAEVGPIKYIAALIYGDNPDTNILEKAVTWVIITIIFVFDPLAILLILSSQMTYQWIKKEDSIVDEVEEKEDDRPIPPPVFIAPEPDRDVQPEDPVEDLGGDTEVENRIVEPEPEIEEPKKKDTSSEVEGSLEESQVRKQELEEQEKDATWSDAKRAWKEDHPTLTLKEIKEQYIKGEIDVLPWEEYRKPHKYVMKENGEQVTKETQPESSEGNAETGYIQNGEQNETTLWKRLKGEQ
jgi:hypothetical protein